MGRPYAGGSDKLKLFINSRWHLINSRTVNGLHPDMKSKAKSDYILRGVRVEFTRKEFEVWCELRRADILAMDQPSIDRIGHRGNYSLPNMRVIPFTQNCAQGGKVKLANKTACLEQAYVKYCLACAVRLTRNQWRNGRWEATKHFKKRLTCNKACSMFLRIRGTDGRMQKWKG